MIQPGRAALIGLWLGACSPAATGDSPGGDARDSGDADVSGGDLEIPADAELAGDAEAPGDPTARGDAAGPGDDAVGAGDTSAAGDASVPTGDTAAGDAAPGSDLGPPAFTVALEVSSSPAEGQLVTLGALASGGVPPYSYAWDMDDGRTETEPSGALVHVWDEDGTYELRVTVTDDGGDVAAASLTVFVDNAPPGVSLSAPARWGTVAPLAAAIAVHDPGATDTTSGTVSWGDGSPPDDLSAEAGRFHAHSYAAAGSYTITAAALDDDGGLTIETAEVEVVDGNLVTVTLDVTDYAVAGEPLQGIAAARDLLGLPLAVTVSAPPGLTFDGPTGILEWPAAVAGLHAIEVEASDGVATGSATVSLFVSDVRWVDEVLVSAALGAVLEDTDPASPTFGARIDIPPGALAADTLVRMGEVLTPAPGQLRCGPVLELFPTGLVLSVPATLTLPYAESVVPAGVSPEEIRIATWLRGDAGRAGAWRIEEDGAVDTAARRVSAPVHHFSEWTPWGEDLEIYRAGNFVVRYARAGPDAPLRDCTPAEIAMFGRLRPPVLPGGCHTGRYGIEPLVPDYIEDLGRHLVDARSYYSTRGYALPTGNCHVKVADMEGDGSTGLIGCHMDFKSSLPRRPLKDTATHELFHVVQGAARQSLASKMGRMTARWLEEAAATYMELEVHPAIEAFETRQELVDSALLIGTSVDDDHGATLPAGYILAPAIGYLNRRLGVDLPHVLFNAATPYATLDVRYAAAPYEWFHLYIGENWGDLDATTLEDVADLWQRFSLHYHFTRDPADVPPNHPPSTGRAALEPSMRMSGRERAPGSGGVPPLEPPVMAWSGPAPAMDEGSVATYVFDLANVLCDPASGGDCADGVAVDRALGGLVIETTRGSTVQRRAFRVPPAGPVELLPASLRDGNRFTVPLALLSPGDVVAVTLWNEWSAGIRQTPRVRGWFGSPAIVGGDEHTCVQRSSGTVACWGRNRYGHLGRGTTVDSGEPADVLIDSVTVLDNVVELAEGPTSQHRCAVRRGTNGSELYCWGLNSCNALGIGMGTPSAAYATHVIDGSIAEVAVGSGTTCVVGTNGHASCWGYNDTGQLGLGYVTGPTTPCAYAIGDVVAPAGESGLLSNIEEIVLGEEHGCARRSDGTVWCWGADYALGDGAAAASSPVPVQVVGLTDVIRISAGITTCALKSDGSVWCWGYGYFGQLGDAVPDPYGCSHGGCWDDAPAPVQALVQNVTHLQLGYMHACAVSMGGAVTCWGANDSQQSGGDPDDWYFNDPRQVVGGAAAVVGPAVQHTCGFDASGSVSCWGWNRYGNFGAVTIDATRSTVPVPSSFVP